MSDSDSVSSRSYQQDSDTEESLSSSDTASLASDNGKQILIETLHISRPPAYVPGTPREADCFDLGGCSISEVNKPCNRETGSVFFIFISNRNALRGVKKNTSLTYTPI